eukprot:GEMP01114952.1.p1 GENE.GEMP01114952.1~~GEMP01114952.1.p1  ORF type:complete len:188 (+),score=30.78 GEMP01114952.1:87-650(+)
MMKALRLVGGATTAVGAGSIGWWEWRRSHLFAKFDETRRQFEEVSTGVPFYGRRSGYTVDYGIETSLHTGDYLEAIFDYRYLPWHRAARRYLNRRDDGIDEVGIVLLKNSQVYVITVDSGSWYSTPYATWLANPAIHEAWLNTGNDSRQLHLSVEALVKGPAPLELRVSKDHTWPDGLEVQTRLCVR